MAVEDPTTNANYDEIKSEHIHLVWQIDWHKHSVHGTATHTLKALVDGVDSVVCVPRAFATAEHSLKRVSLDTSNLVVDGAEIDGKEATVSVLIDYLRIGAHSTLQFALGADAPVLGAALTVKLPGKLSKGSTVDVKVRTPRIAALRLTL